MIEPTRENAEASKEEKVGEVTGGLAGALAGVGLGSLAGPIGAIVGGIAGAAGGWWAGEEVGRTIGEWSDEDERAMRTYLETIDGPGVDYGMARAAYVIGYMAAGNPTYDGFTDPDEHFNRNWAFDDQDYKQLRPHVHAGYKSRRR